MRALGLDPVHDTQSAFRALCDATARPGTVVDVGASPADHAIVATLVDHEVTTWTADDELHDALEHQGRLEEAPPAEADVVHVRGTTTDAGGDGAPEWDVRECTRGTLVEPSEGATVIYRVDVLAERTEGIADPADPIDADDADGAADADAADLTTVELSGPGVDGTRRVTIGLPAGELERLADAQSTYPRGVDAYVAAGERVVAIPRSSELEVV